MMISLAVTPTQMPTRPGHTFGSLLLIDLDITDDLTATAKALS